MFALPFLQPDAADRIARQPLDRFVRHRCEELLERGYTLIRHSIPAADCAAAMDAFKACTQRYPDIFARHQLPNGRFERIVNLHLLVPALQALFTRNATLLAVQDACFGGETSLYTSLYYEIGSQQSIHRDSPYFATRPEYAYFGASVYLEPADDENGCLEVIEGGHAILELDREAMATARYGAPSAVPAIDMALWVEYQQEVLRLCEARNLPRRRIHAEPGDTLIWHPQLPHGGTQIKDGARTRNSLVMHTTPVGVPVYGADVFFQPRAQRPTAPAWSYEEMDGRKIAAHGHVSFGQDGTYSLAQIRASG